MAKKANQETAGPKVVLIRHGKTARNGEGSASPDRIRGWDDVPLTDEGRMQAHQTGQQLKKLAPADIFTSDLSRATETAKIISRHTANMGEIPSAFVKDTSLRPWNLGQFQGQESNKVAPQMKDHIENPDKPVPGGEPFNAFKNRFLGRFSQLLEQSAKQKKNIFVVAHYRNAMLARAWDKAGRPKDFSFDKATMESRAEHPPGDFDVYSPEKSDT